jgi:hypothetical protein
MQPIHSTRHPISPFPPAKQRELERVVQIIFEEFGDTYVKARYSKYCTISEEELTWPDIQVAIRAMFHPKLL